MTFLELKKYFLFLHYTLTKYTLDIPMSKYEPNIAEVLSDSKLIDNAIAKLPTNP